VADGKEGDGASCWHASLFLFVAAAKKTIHPCACSARFPLSFFSEKSARVPC
jgi:hypothetical protein